MPVSGNFVGSEGLVAVRIVGILRKPAAGARDAGLAIQHQGIGVDESPFQRGGQAKRDGGGVAAGVAAVSYTHLDVYKRQGRCRGFWVRCARPHRSGERSEGRLPVPRFDCCISYNTLPF